jgi:hypothetical protein
MDCPYSHEVSLDPTSWTAEQWTAIGSGATALAFLVSAWVLALQLKDRRRRSPERLSAWIDDKYVSDPSGGLVRRAHVHISNVGDQPVYDLLVVVGHGYTSSDVARLGPLGVPLVAVVSPGREEVWPIHDQLKSFETVGVLRVEVSFRDSAGRWWTRQFDGGLKRWYRGRARVVSAKSPEHAALAEAQMGVASLDNPLTVAMIFKSLLSQEDSEERLMSLRLLSTPESVEAWGDYAATKEMLEDHGMSTLPNYPAPGIAYVKLMPNVDEPIVVTGPMLMEVSILTLQYRQELDPPGWRVHQVGAPAPPDQMPGTPSADGKDIADQ